jgi:hypothetical protein
LKAKSVPSRSLSPDTGAALQYWRVRSNARQRRLKADVFPPDHEAPKRAGLHDRSDTGAALQFWR